MTSSTTRALPDSGLGGVEPLQLKGLLERGEAVLIDVREPEEHAREHIAGSVLMPLSKLDPARVPVAQRVVLHCRTGARSAEAARALLGAGRPAVEQLQGGIAAWRNAGLPVVENRRVPISIMRQVQIVAGSIVVVGTILGAVVSPWLLLLSGFIGAGLMFSGITGSCGMAALLRRMPWNRIEKPTDACAQSCNS